MEMSLELSINSTEADPEGRLHTGVCLGKNNKVHKCWGSGRGVPVKAGFYRGACSWGLLGCLGGFVAQVLSDEAELQADKDGRGCSGTGGCVGTLGCCGGPLYRSGPGMGARSAASGLLGPLGSSGLLCNLIAEAKKSRRPIRTAVGEPRC